jgi:DNA-binding transcriptional ArsR family regulator
MHFKQESHLPIDTPLVQKAIEVLHALKHPLRQQMLQVMHRRERIHVTELYIELRLEQSIASQQLGILRRTGLVKNERRGKHIYYSVDYAYLKHIEALCGEMLEGQAGSRSSTASADWAENV